MHLVMFFVDGFGLGSEEANPIVAARTPVLDRLLGGHLLWGERVLAHGQTVLRPLDASLGVQGVPQSATGQTTLWTGVNAAKALGYHLNAYPNEALAQIIAEHSLFKQLAAYGKKVTFANAFTSVIDQSFYLNTKLKKRYSASTLSALAGGVRLRRAKELLEGKAVFQDMVNEIMRERGEDVPLFTPFEAGQNLGRVGLEHDFTLYEYFQTDKKGHKQVWDECVDIIERIDSFLGGFLSIVERKGENQGNEEDKDVPAGNEDNIALILTSDHGNIEDFRVKGHTLNPVPALCWSKRPLKWPEWRSIEEVTPGIVELLTKGETVDEIKVANHGIAGPGREL